MKTGAHLISHGRQPAQSFPEPCSTGTLTAPSNFRRFCWNITVRIRNLWHWRTAWAVRHLSRQLKRDPDFRQSWHANIAMPIYDATRPQCYCDKLLRDPASHPDHFPNCELEGARRGDPRFQARAMPIEQANYIADRLMKHLFGA